MVKKSFLILSVFVLTAFFSINFCSALYANFTNITGGIERSLNMADSTNLINFSVGAVTENITKVQFIITGSTFQDKDKFIINSNGTNAASYFFSNSTVGGTNYGDSHTVVLTFTNTSAGGIVSNSSTKNFWFNINSKSSAASSFSILVNATGISGTANQSNGGTPYSWAFTFRFSGYVKNETGGLLNATNVSIWDFQEGQNGPVETEITRTQTGSSGEFTLSGINADGARNYKLKIVLYNQSNPAQALKIGTNLPAFPAEMYYARIYNDFESAPQYNFMRPPSFNGTTFYVGPAATLNISATNGTTPQRFGYMVMEQGTGFPLESNGNANVTNALIVVPLNRRYTVMGMRSNTIFGNIASCNGVFMNDTACRTPPKSNSTIYPSVDGQTISISLDLSISRKNMFGCIGVSGNSTAITNVSLILPKMMPWSGFVPPARADVQDINLSSTAQLNYSDPRCPGKLAWYNISVLNSDYLVEFYGRNNTAGIGGEFLGILQNASFTSASQNINVTLLRLSGFFSSASAGEILLGTGTNTTKFTIRVQNSSGAAITQDKPHIEVTLKNASIFGEITYVAEPSNGSFSVIVPSGTTGKVKVFSNNAPPKERNFNSSLSELNITLVNMQGGDGGFRRKNSSGQLEAMNISEDSFNVNMGFFRTGGVCDGVIPDSSCNLTSMGARNFNPFVALVAGKVNLQLKLSNGVGITFYNFDMFSAKQPPMESVMNNQASTGGTSATPVWEFGSFVPAEVYDYAIVSIPYSDSVINDSAEVRMKIPYLYDENWNAVFNTSRGDTGVNLSTEIDDYLGNANNRSFNATGYRAYLNSTGVLCNNTNSSITGSTPTVYCYLDTANNLIYMRVPHFSGVASGVTATAPSTTVATSASSPGGGSLTTSGWITTYAPSINDLANGYLVNLVNNGRVKLSVLNETHYVGIVEMNTTAKTIKINVSSETQQAVLAIGDERKFEVTGDNYYDILIKLNNVTSTKADLLIKTINELMPVLSSSSNNAASNNTSSGQETTEDKVAISNLIWWLVGIIIVLILAYLIFLGNKRAKWNKIVRGIKVIDK